MIADADIADTGSGSETVATSRATDCWSAHPLKAGTRNLSLNRQRVDASFQQIGVSSRKVALYHLAGERLPVKRVQNGVMDEAEQVIGLYRRHASAWAEDRGNRLIEGAWLDRFLM